MLRTNNAMGHGTKVRAVGHYLKYGSIGLLALAAACTSLSAFATVIPVSVNFVAEPQSMWGPDVPAAGINYSQNFGVPLPFGLGTFNVGYGLSATTGQVSGNVTGVVNTSYTDTLSAPGTTSIGLGFAGLPLASGLHSDVGAEASLTFGGTIHQNANLQPGTLYTAGLGSGVSAGDAATDIVQIPIIDVLVASAGVGLGVSQTDYFTPTSIDGALNYSLEGSGTAHNVPLR